jgi:uncharacterized protein YdeI (YjbR/CyaY-like superfamily)
MAKKDPRIDAYIAKAAPFAKPILKHLRALVHKGCPEIEETMKWSFPNFDYKGIMCSMAAFKEHCSFGFWKAELLLKPEERRSSTDGDGMGQFGRITSLEDLPKDEVLLGYIKEARRLNDEGIKRPTAPKAKVKKELVVPSYFISALQKKKMALTTFENFSYSHKKEYVQWLTEAKTDETRNRRLEAAVAWLAEGKPRNWKYMNC